MEDETPFEEEYEEVYESDTEDLDDISVVPTTEIPDSLEFYKNYEYECLNYYSKEERNKEVYKFNELFREGGKWDKAAKRKPKSWKEIWGSGQGISAVKSIMPAGELVKRINNEYIEAKNKLI